MEMRAWRGLLLIGVLLLGVFVATLLVTAEMITFVTVGIGLACVAVALDYWSWLVVPWDPVAEPAVGPTAGEAAS
jgi:protein-S-isoprenylcysteine O-methyltransferase Ste14